MEWDKLIEQLGGGLGAVSLLALAYAYWQERRRNNELSDNMTGFFLNITKDTTAAINALTAAIKEAGRGSGQ